MTDTKGIDTLCVHYAHGNALCVKMTEILERGHILQKSATGGGGGLTFLDGADEHLGLTGEERVAAVALCHYESK